MTAFKKETEQFAAKGPAATSPQTLPAGIPGETVSVSGKYTVLPGFCDVHVHFREPGFSYKERIATGTAAAAAGGYTAVCTMPNLRPVPDSVGHMREETDIIGRDAVIPVYPFASITVGERGAELSDMRGIAKAFGPESAAGCRGFVAGFSDDGVGVQSESLMREAMETAAKLGLPIVAHCEDESLRGKGYIHDGSYARAHGLPGISSESEWRQIERDLKLAAETGCRYHVCHISCRESVRLIREAKRRGVDVTCETAPHYLLLDCTMLRDEGRFRMNPPLREPSDREALIDGVIDGTVDMIATDHAPHSAAEKAGGLAGSLFGIVGLETAFPALYTGLVKKGIISLEKLITLLTTAPRRRFGIPAGGFSVWDLGISREADPEKFLSMGRSTPFAGEVLFGECLMTSFGGKTVYRRPGAGAGAETALAEAESAAAGRLPGQAQKH